MREQEFRAWLENWEKPRGGPLKRGNLNFYFNTAREVERVESISLDKEFKKDKMTSLYDYYKYSKQDQRDNLPNPTNMELPREIYASLRDIRSALNHYRRFCDKNPPK